MAPRFTAYIVGKHLPPGVSAAAWKIVTAGSTWDVDGKRSRGGDSTHIRGTVAAAWGVMEKLPRGASVTIHSNVQHFVDGINGDAGRWRKNGFRMRNGKPRANADLWRKFLGVRDAKEIEACAEYAPDGSHYAEVKARAFDEANAKRSEQHIVSRTVGTNDDDEGD